MAWSLTVTPGSDRMYITVNADANYQLRRCWVDDEDRSDYIVFNASAGPISLEDNSVLQEQRYYYWLKQYGGSTFASANAKLFQPKAFGRRGGGHARRRFDYDIECPKCGFEYPRNLFKRGYVKPHVTGTNYLPFAASPEDWDWSLIPHFRDINAYFFQQGRDDPLLGLPQIERPLEKASRYGGGHRYAGVPCILNTAQPGGYIDLGNPPGTNPPFGYDGYLIIWVWRGDDVPADEPVDLKLKAMQVTGSDYIETPIAREMSKGWHRIWKEFNWDGVKGKLRISITGGTSSYLPQYILFGFGGAQIVSAEPEMASLPDRKTALGEYTIGGMMDLCPDCYSGLRRRVPWD